MLIKTIKAKSIKDSRKNKTISITIKTTKASFTTSAPSGKSTGKYEAKPYNKTLQKDINFINKLNIQKINQLNINNFQDLEKIERLTKNKIGANTLFTLEASLLKALAKQNNKQLYKFLSTKKPKFPIPVGNAIGGGLHSKGIKNKKPDFQEFLFIPKSKTFKQAVNINNKAYNLTKKFLKAKKTNDEGGWETNLNNEQVLEVMNKVKQSLKKQGYNLSIGLDIASSSFFKNNHYLYKNPKQTLTKKQQINYIKQLIKKYKIFYIEDPLDENDFTGFKELKNKTNCLIIGDDLTTTNPKRLKRAIKTKSINAIIIKPNQIGSLIKLKQTIDLAKKHNIKTIISHRSGETLDNTIADLAIAFQTDFIKTGIYGKVRTSKLKRLIRIEKNR